MNQTVETELSLHVRRFGDHLKKFIIEKNIKYLIPLETKGALLIDVACGQDTLPDTVDIIYPRALRYLSNSSISNNNILLVDDIFFTGRHLKRIYDYVLSYGATIEKVHCMAFLDFSCGVKNKDYDGYTHDLICKNMLGGPILKRNETLRFLQNAMLEKTMPSVYDHLTIEAREVDEDKYLELLAKLSKLNRLLHYGQRGAYQASSILLDDMFGGSWDVPPKARLWWNDTNKTLRITPVGFFSSNNSDKKMHYAKDLHALIVNSIKSGSEDDVEEASYESTVLSGRIQQLLYLKKILKELRLKFSLDNDHLDRYYPGLGITDQIHSILKTNILMELPARHKIYEDQGYYSAIVDILDLSRKAWANQEHDQLHKLEKSGYSASDLFRLLPQYNEIQIHSALDYCFDFHYLAVFRKKGVNGFSRCYRTTEISQDLLPEEIFGAAVIYSLKSPTPDWLINKVFPIIRSITPGLIYDGQLVITKAFFGDVTRIKQSEDSCCSWKDVQSDLWNIENLGAGVCYKKKEDPATVQRVAEIMNDSRLAGFRDTLAAIVFLLENGGRDASIILDILTPGYGGADYVTYNLSKLLSNGSKHQDLNVSNMIEWHSKGADEKLDLLLGLFEPGDNIIKKLERRSSRLQQTYLIQVQAQKAINKAKPFSSRVLYDALSTLKSGISGAVMAAKSNNAYGFNEALKLIGITLSKRSQSLRYTLSQVSGPIHRILYAISAQTFPWDYYKKFLVTSPEKFKIILGYDLTSERRKHFQAGEELTRFDDDIHKLIANWIVAFNGKVATLGVNAGDLRFGFFSNIDEAICCGCWTIHHLDQLKHTKRFPVGSESLGIVISGGDIEIDNIGNTLGGSLDLCGHLLKDKLNNLSKIDAAASSVGRKNSHFTESQIYVLEHSIFEVDRTERKFIGSPKNMLCDNICIKLSPIYVEQLLTEKPTPWLGQ